MATEPEAPAVADVHTGAQVINEGRKVVAECPGCEWRSKPSPWWGVAQDRADGHNRKEHPEEDS